jgi:23S rRNA pseudouridine1911/1915/1917 synthase
MTSTPRSPTTLRFYFEDPNLLVVEKPAGLLSQGEHTGDTNLVDELRAYLGRHYVGLVHRLDRNTSGIMVVAKRTKAASRLTAALQKGTLTRTYLAWVHGTIGVPGRWVHELMKDEATNTVRVVRAPCAGSKNAALAYIPVGHGTFRGAPLTLLELHLETGRSHQIRVQASAAHHPLLGDTKYETPLEPHIAAISREFGRPALHSSRITFPHPIGGAPHTFESPLPPDMRGIELRSRAEPVR